MIEIFVAHEVLLRREFNRHITQNNLIGCEVYNNYYIKNEVVLIVGSEEHGYTYLDGYKEGRVVDINLLRKLDGSISIYSCDTCQKASQISHEQCRKSIETEEVIGLIGIERANDFTKANNISSSIILIREYNDTVKGQCQSINNIIKKKILN